MAEVKVTKITGPQYAALLRDGEAAPRADPEAFASAARLVQREWGDTGYRMGHVGHGLFMVVHSDGSRFLITGDRYGNTSVVEGPEIGQHRRRSSRTASRVARRTGRR